MPLSVVALSLSMFAIGTTEFVVIGLTDAVSGLGHGGAHGRSARH